MSSRRRSIHDALRMMLARARYAAGVSQAELAGHLEWPQSVISKIEAGLRTVSVDDLVAIASVLGVNPMRLLEKAIQLADQPTSLPKRKATRVSQRPERTG